MKHILFVCTGNTCRSPLAEGMFRQLAKARGYAVEIRSAGVHAVDGQPISQHSSTILEQKGITETLTSSALNESVMAWADLILTMTMNHKAAIIQQYPEAVEKVYTLKEYVGTDANHQDVIEERDRLLSELQMKQALSEPISQEEAERFYALQAKLPDPDVADPFGGSIADYESCAQEIEGLLYQLVDHLKLTRESES